MVLKVKSHLQGLLKRTGLYHRMKASLVYDLYWRFADRSLIDSVRKEVNFYRTLLGDLQSNNLIFDVGANQGVKTGVFLDLGARVVAVEPDDINQKILQERFLKFRYRPRPVVIVGKALSDHCGTETMWVDEPGSAKNTLNRKWTDALRHDESRFGHTLKFGDHKEIETTTLETLMSIHGVPWFIKIDVEGHELNVLKGLRQPVPYLSFEINLPEFLPEGLECVEVLNRLVGSGKFNYLVDCCQGFKLESWLGAKEFSQALSACRETSIEVFWKTNVNS